MAARWRIVCGFAFCGVIFGQSYSPPAGIRPARQGSESSILPGGRIVAPAGQQFLTGAGALGLALSASGRVLVTANMGPPAASLTVLEHGKVWEVRSFPAAIAGGEHAGGVALAGEHAAFVSEGSSGRVALVDLAIGDRRTFVDLNQSGYHDSFSGDLALDAARSVLYVADRANSRVAAIDGHVSVILTRPRRVLASVALGGMPVALALSPDRNKLYVTEPESASVSVIDVSDPSALKVEAVLRTGSGPSNIIATAGRVYVSHAADDSITVIDAGANRVEAEIPVRIRGLPELRGIAPAGLAYDEKTGWLLVAEAGINAVGVIDTRALKVVGHIPAGWSPTRVAIDRGTVYVANQRGQSSHPSARVGLDFVRVIGEEAGQGSVSIYTLPSLAALAGYTEFVLRAAGLVASLRSAPSLPPGIRHVVLIVKAGRAFDEVLGDVRRAANGPVAGAPALARFGKYGSVNGRRERLSLHDVNLTPNHHAIAERWAFSDNFYADSELGGIWDHLSRNGISVYNFSAARRLLESSDTERAGRFIREINDRYVATGVELPQVLYVYLPNDRLGTPRPDDGYPYEESFLVDNDYALGRILEFLSGTPWWGSMAVFVTEDSARGGADHIDAHRTLLLCAGPWMKRNYVSHTNSSFPGLLKTIFEILHVPPMNLSDASAADLSDCFMSSGDASPYRVAPVDKRVYDPGLK